MPTTQLDDDIPQEEMPLQQNTNPSRKRRLAVAIVGMVSLVVLVVIIITAVALRQANRTPFDPPQSNLVDMVQISDIMKHLTQLEDIAKLNNNSRSVRLGYNMSAAYIIEQLSTRTEFTVTKQYFTKSYYVEVVPSVVTLTSPFVKNFIENTDFAFMGDFAGELSVNASLSIVANLGCSIGDYSAFSAGRIALIKRGNCTFEEKAKLAVQAQAAAAFIFNDGATADRTGIFLGSLGQSSLPIPIFSMTYSLGSILSVLQSPSLAITINTQVKNYTTFNIIADVPSTTATTDRVVILGSHLDSVDAGPGINDNGSGSATNLQLALLYNSLLRNQRNRLRFCWWSAEEVGLVGSKYYVSQLSNDEKSKIIANVNIDMIGSPNHIYGIYNGSSANETIRSGCEYIQQLFIDYFTKSSAPWQFTAFDGRSDYGPFLESSIAAGGLFTGADGIKTSDERVRYGGLANTMYDPCYHQACDTVANINQAALLLSAQAVASVIQDLSNWQV